MSSGYSSTGRMLRLTSTVPALPAVSLKPLAKAARVYTSKIHPAVDAYGLSIAFSLTGGNVNDSTEVPELIAQLPAGGMIMADKGYNNERIRSRPRIREPIRCS